MAIVTVSFPVTIPDNAISNTDLAYDARQIIRDALLEFMQNRGVLSTEHRREGAVEYVAQRYPQLVNDNPARMHKIAQVIHRANIAERLTNGVTDIKVEYQEET